jgi:hypothetical protein
MYSASGLPCMQLHHAVHGAVAIHSRAWGQGPASRVQASSYVPTPRRQTDASMNTRQLMMMKCWR